MPTARGAVFFKACRPVQAFEPRLTAELAGRWPDLVADVLGHDDARAWLLTADAGPAIGDIGNPPERWLEVLPRYAELQRGEAAFVQDHLRHGVPDLRTAVLPERFEELLRAELPLAPEEVAASRTLGPALAALVADLAGAGVPDSIDHADLHLRSVFAGRAGDGPVRVLDWGDASAAHPFLSPFVTFQFLREVNGLGIDDPWFARLRDAYLEPWGSGLVGVFEAAQRLAAVARALGWHRHHRAMGSGAFGVFDDFFPGVLRTAFSAIRAQ